MKHETTELLFGKTAVAKFGKAVIDRDVCGNEAWWKTHDETDERMMLEALARKYVELLRTQDKALREAKDKLEAFDNGDKQVFELSVMRVKWKRIWRDLGVDDE